MVNFARLRAFVFGLMTLEVHADAGAPPKNLAPPPPTKSGRCAAENLKLLPPTIGRRAAVIAAKNVHFKFEFECVLHAAICLLTYSVRSYLNKSKKKSTKVSILQQSTGTEC